MSAFRDKKFTSLSKAVVVMLGVLLVSALGAAWAHVTVTEHSYCESHQAFEHADESEQSLEHRSPQKVELAHVDVGNSQAPAHDPDSSDESCDWLTWLQGPSVPLPELHASLVNLPPPAHSLAARPLVQQAHIPSQIDLLRLSPGHSPPVLTA